MASKARWLRAASCTVHTVRSLRTHHKSPIQSARPAAWWIREALEALGAEVRPFHFTEQESSLVSGGHLTCLSSHSSGESPCFVVRGHMAIHNASQLHQQPMKKAPVFIIYNPCKQLKGLLLAYLSRSLQSNLASPLWIEACPRHFRSVAVTSTGSSWCPPFPCHVMIERQLAQATRSSPGLFLYCLLCARSQKSQYVSILDMPGL